MAVHSSKRKDRAPGSSRDKGTKRKDGKPRPTPTKDKR